KNHPKEPAAAGVSGTAPTGGKSWQALAIAGGAPYLCAIVAVKVRAASGLPPMLRKGKFMPKIALVDDDRNIITSVSLTLEAEGYSVSTYTDGASGLEGLTSDRPDLAILDIKMPRMDGMELLRRL